MSFTYNEPKENEYEPLPEGDYPFSVEKLQGTYHNEKGTFILPVEIALTGTGRKIKTWLSAGVSAKGEPFDMISPFLKCIRRNPAVGEEPDFSSQNLLGATGEAHIKEMPYKGDNDKYQGMSFPTVRYWKYDREQANATVSQGAKASPEAYKKPAPRYSEPMDDDGDDIPF